MAKTKAGMKAEAETKNEVLLENVELFTEACFLKAQEGDFSALRAIPKADLHAHAMLSAPIQAFASIAPEGFEYPPSNFKGLPALDAYCMKHIFPLLKSNSVRAAILRAAIEEMKRDSVAYAELSFDISASIFGKTTWKIIAQDLFPVIQDALPQIKISPELGMGRGLDPALALAHAEEAFASGFFQGIDIYGDEQTQNLQDLLPIVELARASNLRIKLHSGENCSLAQLEREIKLISPHALQHGIRASESAQLMRYLADEKIKLNICPESNVRLGFVKDYATHPIRKLFDAGVLVTVNTDDVTLFSTSLSGQYLKLWEASVFSLFELEKIRTNAFDLTTCRRVGIFEAS